MTAPETPVVELLVGPSALHVDVFDGYAIDLSMLEVGAAFSFSFWYSTQARAAWRTLLDGDTGLKCGHRVTLTVDGDAVLSGLVETRVVGDTGGRSPPAFIVSGRDLLGAAVSGDADPSLTLAGRALEDALDALYRGVGLDAEVAVAAEALLRATTSTARSRRGLGGTSLRALKAKAAAGNVAALGALEAVGATASRPPYGVTAVRHPRIGEKVQQVVEHVVRALGFRVWTTPGEGAQTYVVVDRPRSSGEPAMRLLRELEGGAQSARSNVEAGRETVNVRDVPTSVTVFADGARGDRVSEKIARTVENGWLLTPAMQSRVATDLPPQPRYVTSKHARTAAGAHNEAARRCAEANEHVRTYEATVLGHRQQGRLWMPNTLVAVRDDLVGLDETMLLVRAQLTGSRNDGPKTQLTLLPLGALSEAPEFDA